MRQIANTFTLCGYRLNSIVMNVMTNDKTNQRIKPNRKKASSVAKTTDDSAATY